MSNYFRKLPNFEYVSRLPDAKISDYITVKNLFKKGALEQDILENLALHTKYKIVGENNFLTIATTRPETMIGDTAVAVNPKDERYKNERRLLRCPLMLFVI